MSEYQNDIETRIKETPRLETQSVFSGLETEVKRLVKLARVQNKENNTELFQSTPDKHYSTIGELGTSALDNEYSPAFKISLLKGEISGSVGIRQDDVRHMVNISQINVNVEYENSIEYTVLEDDAFSQIEEKIFQDGSYVKVQDDFVLINIEELNNVFEKENFDIEVYEIELIESQYLNSSGSIENLIPLYFMKKEQNMNNFEINPNYVEYYMNISVDYEIDENIYCEYKADKTKNIFSDSILACPEKNKK